MFKGSDTELVNTLNVMAEAIHDTRFNAMKDNPNYSYEPRIIAYVGRKQVAALMSIAIGNSVRYEQDKFMDAKVVKVVGHDYLHIVLTNPFQQGEG